MPAALSEEESKLQELVEDLLNMANSFLERKKFETSETITDCKQGKNFPVVSHKEPSSNMKTTYNANNSKSKKSAAIYEEVVFDNKKFASVTSSNTVKSYDSGFFQQVPDEGVSSSLNFQVHSLLDQYDADDEISESRIAGRSDCRMENINIRSQHPLDEKAAVISDFIKPKFKPKRVGSPVTSLSRAESVGVSNRDNSNEKKLLLCRSATVKKEMTTDYKGQEIVKSQENFQDFIKKNRADETHLNVPDKVQSKIDRTHHVDQNLNGNCISDSHNTCIPSNLHKIYSSNNSTLREFSSPLDSIPSPQRPNLLETHNVGYADRSMNVSPDPVAASLGKNTPGIVPLKQRSQEFDLKSEDDDANSLLTETLTCAVSASISSLTNTDEDDSSNCAFSYVKGRNVKPLPKKEIITLKPIGAGVQLLENEGKQSPRTLPYTHQHSKTFQGVGYTFHEPQDMEMGFTGSVGFYTPQPSRNCSHDSQHPSVWNNHQRKFHTNLDANDLVCPQNFTSNTSSPRYNYPTPSVIVPRKPMLDDFDRSVHSSSNSCSPYTPSTSARNHQNFTTNHNNLSGQVSEDFFLNYPHRQNRDAMYRSPGIDSWKSSESSYQFGSPLLSNLSRPRLTKSSSNSSNSNTYRIFSPQASSNSSMSACSPLMSPCFATDQSKYWYHPSIPRDEAIGLLLDAPAGSFIIRNSSMFDGAYGLALKVDKLPVNVKFDRDSPTCLVRHFLIETTATGVKVKGSPIEPTFGSLSTLVYQHMLTPLSLPCKLILNKFGDDLITHRDCNNNDDIVEDVEGIFLYVHAENTEGLTGQAALNKLVNETFTKNSSSSTFISKFKVTEVKFKVDKEGLTLTDLERKLFFRKKYQWKYISYSGVESSNRIYVAKNYENRDVSLGRLFCIVTRNISSPNNTCHLLANKDPENTVLISIIDSINKKISI